MTGTIRIRTFLALPRAVFTLLGLTAIIIGILAMHVWMGGHGPTTAHGLHTITGPAVTAHQATAPADAGTHAMPKVEIHAAEPDMATGTSKSVQWSTIDPPATAIDSGSFTDPTLYQPYLIHGTAATTPLLRAVKGMRQ